MNHVEAAIKLLEESTKSGVNSATINYRVQTAQVYASLAIAEELKAIREAIQDNTGKVTEAVWQSVNQH